MSRRMELSLTLTAMVAGRHGTRDGNGNLGIAGETALSKSDSKKGFCQ